MPGAYDADRRPAYAHGPTEERRPGPRLVAIRKAETLLRELAGLNDPAELRARGRRLVQEARLVVAELDATSRE
jgi:hypothetical protein